TGNSEIHSASYSFRSGKVQVTCLDPWDRETDMIAFLEEELSGSDAKFKFVAMHEPVIPVTERCWNTFRKDRERRENLLEVIASHGAIVLCGHLHRYSIVRRTTDYGPIVQVMVTSVVQDRNYLEPTKVITSYGPALAENVPGWQPESLQARKAILSEEAQYVSYYKQTDLPGYILLTMDEKEGSIIMEYYAAFGENPYDTVDLTVE
ncbi:MAG: metallophosphoesterase, partial [Bacteroidales bacterium]|nr:metallophosphoesterase [Bacteroidales bacterium]